MFEEISNIKTENKDLRSFGITIGIILIIIGIFLFFKEKEYYQVFIYVAVPLIGFGLIIPIILKPIYIVWMVFAIILGWIMTRLILSLLFYLIITPIGIVLKISGKQFLKLKITDQKSHWNYRNSKIEASQDYEKQF